MFRSPALLVVLLACADGAGDADATPGDGCNGHPDLCGRSLDQLVVPMTHNAMSNEEEGWLVPNQRLGLERQLADGIRGFMLDTHEGPEGQSLLCHSLCDLGSEPLVDGLAKFTTFLQSDPDDVLVFMIQNGLSAQATKDAFDQAGLTPYTYAHDPAQQWPLVSELVAADTRLVVFHEGGGTEYGWYMDGYAHHVWDTGYGQDTPEEMGCDLLRGETAHPLYLMNHFLTAPVALPELAEQVNHNPFLLDRAERCGSEAGQPVNFIAVDFHDIGDVIETTAILNGVQ